MADKHTKRGSKPKDTKSLTKTPSKRWFDGWEYTVHAVANDSSRQVRVYYFPNLPEGQQKVIQFQLYGEPLDPLRLVANLLESALYELTKPNATLSNLEGDLGSSHMQGTPTAQGHEADNLSAESAGKDT